MNGEAVRTSGFYRRMIAQDDGPALEELELVVILRGGMANRSFGQLLRQGTIVLEIPPATTMETTVAGANVNSTGVGESAAHRYDVTLRETPASAQRRAAEAAAAASAGEDEPAEATAEPAIETVEDEESDAPADLSQVRVSAPTAVWATALRQIVEAQAPKPTGGRAAPEEPLAPVELAGVEAVLVGLRLEALIETLDRASAVRRSSVDDAFLRLIGERFVAEATPVVGPRVAARIAKDLLGG